MDLDVWMFEFLFPKVPLVFVCFLLSAEFLGGGLLHRPGREKMGQMQPTFLSGILNFLSETKKHMLVSSCLVIFSVIDSFCKPISCC